MAGKDIIVARQKDLKRLYVIHKIIEGAVTQKRTAELILLSERQIRHSTAYVPPQYHLWRKAYIKAAAIINKSPLEAAA